MTTYLRKVFGAPAPQKEAIRGREAEMTVNSAGGYVFPVDDIVRMRRFLVLGSESGSYYATERQMTIENTDAIMRCIKQDGQRALDEILAIRKTDRAPKDGPVLFALAMCAAFGDDDTRRAAFIELPRMATTASQLFMFIDFIDGMRGWGRGMRNGIAGWYSSWLSASALAYQMVKYRSRYNWSHQDILRKAHPKAYGNGMNELFAWATKGTMPPDEPLFHLVHAYEKALNADVDELVQLINDHKMTWEMVPSDKMWSKKVWQTLLPHMPNTALLRNLANLTRYEVIVPLSEEANQVADRLRNMVQHREQDDDDGNGISRFRRLHPISILSALMTYRSGQSSRSRQKWDPIPVVVDALEYAFDKAFDAAPQTNKRFYLAIDISGSMAQTQVAGIANLTPRDAAAAMAMAIARREPNHYIAGFHTTKDYNNNDKDCSIMTPLGITSSDSLKTAVDKSHSMPFGGTDCALPMLDAAKRNMNVDCFVVLTDSETWAGKIHASEALRHYRNKSGIPAKLVVVAMEANPFTIADPNDAGMMDVVGFDSAAPQLIADFVSE